MLANRKSSRSSLASLLHDSRVRQVIHDGQTLYTAVDIVAILAETEHPAELLTDLVAGHPALSGRLISTDADGHALLDLEGVLRLVQCIDSPRAERVKSWLIVT